VEVVNEGARRVDGVRVLVEDGAGARTHAVPPIEPNAAVRIAAVEVAA
jgi:hypothetical protein